MDQTHDRTKGNLANVRRRSFLQRELAEADGRAVGIGRTVDRAVHVPNGLQPHQQRASRRQFCGQVRRTNRAPTLVIRTAQRTHRRLMSLQTQEDAVGESIGPGRRRYPHR